MNFDKLIQLERFTYITNLSPDGFKSKLESIFNRKTFDFKYNLSGKFTDEYKFKATSKWTIGVYIRSFENDPAYLRGTIHNHSKGCKIEVSVRPNSIFMLFGIVFPIVGVTLLINGLNIGDEESVFGGLFFALMGGFWYLVGKFLRRRLKRQFEEYLQVKPERKY